MMTLRSQFRSEGVVACPRSPDLGVAERHFGGMAKVIPKSRTIGDLDERMTTLRRPRRVVPIGRALAARALSTQGTGRSWSTW
jgi:hypothetical protein